MNPGTDGGNPHGSLIQGKDGFFTAQRIWAVAVGMQVPFSKWLPTVMFLL
jgi:hypothetical protein